MTKFDECVENIMSEMDRTEYEPLQKKFKFLGAKKEYFKDEFTSEMKKAIKDLTVGKQSLKKVGALYEFALKKEIDTDQLDKLIEAFNKIGSSDDDNYVGADAFDDKIWIYVKQL
jgi:hypothetical protein